MQWRNLNRPSYAIQTRTYAIPIKQNRTNCITTPDVIELSITPIASADTKLSTQLATIAGWCKRGFRRANSAASLTG